MITKIVLIVLLALAVFNTILSIGEERKPYTSQDAAMNLAVFTLLIIGLWYNF